MTCFKKGYCQFLQTLILNPSQFRIILYLEVIYVLLILIQLNRV